MTNDMLRRILLYGGIGFFAGSAATYLIIGRNGLLWHGAFQIAEMIISAACIVFGLLWRPKY